MWKGNDADREEGEEMWLRPGTQIRLACLHATWTFHVSGTGRNTFSELVLISCHKWWKGGGEKEFET